MQIKISENVVGGKLFFCIVKELVNSTQKNDFPIRNEDLIKLFCNNTDHFLFVPYLVRGQENFGYTLTTTQLETILWSFKENNHIWKKAIANSGVDATNFKQSLHTIFSHKALNERCKELLNDLEDCFNLKIAEIRPI